MTNNSDIIEKIKENEHITLISHDFHLDDDTEVFIKSIRTSIIQEKKLVPVICEDMYEYTDPDTNETQSLHSHSVQYIINCCHDCIKLTNSQLEDLMNNVYYGMRLLETKVKDSLNHPFHQLLYNSIDKNAHLNSVVKDFLIACRFPLIITTSCHPILEKELKGLNYSSYYAKQNGGQYYNNDDEHDATKRKEIHSEPLPSSCIYHIFGKANTTKPDWGYSDKQIMDYLRFALSDGPWKNLASAIKDKSLLFIGNNAPDWLFRFILTPIYGESVYNNRTGYYIHSKERATDDCLLYFLKDISYSKDAQLSHILSKITEEINLLEEHDEETPKRRFKNDIFIAHASEDNKNVELLKTCLESHGLTVYVDSKIEDGNYWSEIVDNLQDSAFFMPYITDEYLTKAKKYMNRDDAFKKLNIDDDLNALLDFNNPTAMYNVYELSKSLSGVAVELMLAEHLLKSYYRRTYSIPIIQNDGWLNPTMIESRGDNGALPKMLFSSQQMRMFYDGRPDPFDGKFPYQKYIQSTKAYI